MKHPFHSNGANRNGAARRYRSKAQRWQAVAQRDVRADGHFVYAVVTTGIYCRPACASKPARQANVRFYTSPALAEADGFRPCRRCRPTETHGCEDAIALACRAIEAAEQPPSLASLAAAAGMSRFHFQRQFAKVLGMSPKAYADEARAERLRRVLPRRGTVTEAFYEAGFNSSGRFYSNAKRLLGMAPDRFRRGGLGETLRVAIGQSSLGAVLVAASPRGVCAVFLGDDPDELLQQAQARFPQARMVAGDRSFERTVALVVGCVEFPAAAWRLPLDLRGTAFQRRVWRALQRIPPGVTASYAEIAQRIGSPRAVRAVAGACAANPVAIAVPCHRVVRVGGQLSGYRWGVARKRALLQREAQAVGRPNESKARPRRGR